MAYATTSDVQAVLGSKLTLSTTSKPTLAQVTTWLDEITADINSALRKGGYSTVPLTGSEDLKVVKGYISRRAALLSVATAWAGAVPQELRELWGGWSDWLDELRNGDYYFPDSGKPDKGVIRVRQAFRRDAYRDTHTEYDNDNYENT